MLITHSTSRVRAISQSTGVKKPDKIDPDMEQREKKNQKDQELSIFSQGLLCSDKTDKKRSNLL